MRLRTYKTKGQGSREAGLAMVFKLTEQAQMRWRRLNGSSLLAEVVGGSSLRMEFARPLELVGFIHRIWR